MGRARKELGGGAVLDFEDDPDECLFAGKEANQQAAESAEEPAPNDEGGEPASEDVTPKAKRRGRKAAPVSDSIAEAAQHSTSALMAEAVARVLQEMNLQQSSTSDPPHAGLQELIYKRELERLRKEQESEAEHAEIRRLTGLSAKERTQLEVEKRWAGDGPKRYLVAVPKDKAQLELTIPAHSIHEARGRYLEVCGITSTQWEVTAAPVD